MKFTEYLIENFVALTEMEHTLYQMVIDNVDNTHVEYYKDHLLFNLGHTIHDSRFDKLEVMVVKDDLKRVKLARRGEKFVVVIYSPKFPTRMGIDTMLAGDRTIKAGFMKAVKRFAKDHYKPDENAEKHPVEHEKEFSTKRNVEKAYKELIAEIKKIEDEYKSGVRELEKKLVGNHSLGHAETVRVAIDSLKDDLLGNTPDEFMSKVKKLDGYKFLAHVEKETKEMIEARLVSYYKGISA